MTRSFGLALTLPSIFVRELHAQSVSSRKGARTGLYQVRDGAVLSRSRDHSHVEVLIQEGAISEEEALDHPMRNFVECCIGGDAPVPDMSITNRKSLESGDVRWPVVRAH
jgi:hypothetical protein